MDVNERMFASSPHTSQCPVAASARHLHASRMLFAGLVPCYLTPVEGEAMPCPSAFKTPSLSKVW